MKEKHLHTLVCIARRVDAEEWLAYVRAVREVVSVVPRVGVVGSPNNLFKGC